jgi:hypothetical protein
MNIYLVYRLLANAGRRAIAERFDTVSNTAPNTAPNKQNDRKEDTLVLVISNINAFAWMWVNWYVNTRAGVALTKKIALAIIVSMFAEIYAVFFLLFGHHV